MYCRYCGKQIEEDSLFCKHCGGSLKEMDKKSEMVLFKIKPWNRFKSLSLVAQIIISVYLIYLLILVCFLIEDSFYCVADFIGLAFIAPFTLACAYYFRKRYKENKAASNNEDISPSKDLEETKVKQESNIGPTVSSHIEESTNCVPNKILKGTVPLLLFAKSYGKMQLVRRAISGTNTTECFCLFEDPDGNATNVLIAKELGVLSAEDISKNKNKLCVREYSDGSFELGYIDDFDSKELPF